MLNESGEIGDDNEHIEIDNGLVMAHNVVQETEKTSYNEIATWLKKKDKQCNLITGKKF